MPTEDDLGKAITNYLWTIENVPGYPWDAAYDVAMTRIGEAVIRQLGLPRGPTEATYQRWADEEERRREVARAERKIYYQAHPEERPLRDLTTAEKRAIIHRDGDRCQYCGTSEDLTVDHKKPRAKGGNNDPANLQALCKSCNSRKGDREEAPVG